MVCAQCGGELVADARFCARCGAPVVMRATPAGGVGSGPVGGSAWGGAGGVDPRPGPSGYGAGPMGYGAGPIRMRVRRNLRTMGVLWCCFGVYRLVSGVVALIFFRTFAVGGGRFGHGFPFGSDFQWPQAPWLAGLVPVIATGIVLSAALAIVTGLALLNRATWARVLAMIVAVLSLIKFPLGTALGIYTLYVLAPRMSGAEWDEMVGPGI